MNTNTKARGLRLLSLVAIVAMLPVGVATAQTTSQPPAPAVPFEAGDMQSAPALPSFGIQTPLVGDTFQTGADRLAALQYSDGGWGWPLVAPPTYFNTLQPITSGFIQAYAHTGDPDHLAGIELARDKLMAKTNNFSPPDGILAAQLDALLPAPACGATTCVARVNSLFYGQLAAGTYNRNGSGTLYNTETYINLIQTARAPLGNMAAWDIGLGLAGAVAAGVDTTNKDIWIQGVKDELNEANVAQDYEVLGLAGGLYGLAKAGATFDPTSGAFTLASDLNGLGAILASYQLASGGFTWDANSMADGNETVQETAYAVLALNALGRGTFLDAILTAGDYLDAAQLGTGGWESYTGSGENNEITGEALWALDVAYPLSTLWVCEVADGDCGHPEAYFHSIQAAIDAATAGADIFVFPGTYDETASNRTVLEGTSGESAPYQFGLFFPIGKPGISVIGIHDDESLITVAGDADAPYVTTNATNNFGPSYFWVEGADVTIRGITQGPNTGGENKSIEVVADGFTLKYFKSDLPNGGGAVYINDWLYDQDTDTSTVNSWNIDSSDFDDGTQVAISSGAGVSGPVSGRLITNNSFDYDPLIAANWPGVSFNGSGTTVAWFVDPVGGSIITGNTFSGSTQYIRSRGTVEEADFDWDSYWNDNTFDRKVIDVASTTPPLLPRAFTYTSGATFPNTRHISALIQHEVDHALAGDTVLVGPGTYVEQVSVSTAITVQGLDPDTSIVQSPDTLSACWGTKKPIICVQNTTATIRDLGVDGAGKGNANYQFIGIAYHNAAGTIEGNIVLDIRNEPLDGMQGGVGIYAYNEDATARTIYVTDNYVEDYQKNAMALNGANLTAHASGNTTIGAGPTSVIAQNGIQLGYGAGGTVLNNTISGNVWTGTYGGSNDPLADPNADAAAGILLYDTNAAVELAGNTLTANQFGVSAVSALSLQAYNNSIVGLAHTGNASPVGIGIWSGDAYTAETATSATLASNTVMTNDYGVVIFDYGDAAPGMSVTASGNIVTQNSTGVALRSNATALTGANFSCNQIYDNSALGADVYGTGTFSPNLFEQNWWGDATGPYNLTSNPSGLGDTVYDGIDFTPWLTTTTCSGLTDPFVGGLSITSDRAIVAVGRPHVGTQVMSYDGLPSAGTTAFVPMLFSNAWGGYNAALYVQNTDPFQTASITIEYRDWDGVLTCHHDDTISPLASRGYWIPSECVPNGWFGGATITSNTPILAVGRPHIGSEITSYNGFSSGSPQMYVPMLFNRAWSSYDAALYVQNTDDAATATVDIDYYDADGNLTCSRSDTLGPFVARGYWMPDECVPAGWVGGAIISANTNIVALGRPHIGDRITAYDGLPTGANTSYVPMLYKTAGTSNERDSALYIQNVDDANGAAISIDFRDPAGTLTCSTTDSIPSLASHGLWLPSLGCLPAGWTGSATVAADYPVVALGRPHFGSEVLSHGGFTAGMTSLQIPMLFSNAWGSYNSGFNVHNIDDAGVANLILKYYNSDGVLVCTKTATLQPKASVDFWVPDELASCP